jgi:site-specific recombinase XerD
MKKDLTPTPSVRLYLDTRRAKQSGKFPVKLRVFTSSPVRKQKLYPTRFEFTETEFTELYNKDQLRGQKRTVREELDSLTAHTLEVCKKIQPFSFEAFERKLYRKRDEGAKVSYQYEQRLQKLKRFGQVKTEQTSRSAMNTLAEFTHQVKKGKFEDLTFYDITEDWLNEYEDFMTRTKERSATTVGIYLRTLRTVFKTAIDEGELPAEYYPFGKRKYIIPATENIKKALNKRQLKTLFEAEPQTEYQRKAKDFWFFTYVCNGINVKDIAKLQFKNIDEDRIRFIRAKTKRTTKGKQKPISVYLNSHAREVIDRYGKKNGSPEQYVFDILKGNESPEDEVRKVQNFTRFINQHLKKLAKANDLPEGISTYWARHSFATAAVRNGASMEFIQESLGHKTVKTTQNYFAGFEDDAHKEMANSLLNFE